VFTLSIEDKAALLVAVRGYEFKERRKFDGGADLVLLDGDSGDKILLRLITEPKSKSGTVNIDAVNNMTEILESEDYDKGVLISRRFTKAARGEMGRKSIQMLSDRYMPSFEPKKLYFEIQDYIDKLCEFKCGRIPSKKSDCKGLSKGRYSCEVRLINDNALFHFSRGWTKLLQKDFLQLLKLREKGK
jgi:hypothetical protein